MYTLSKAPGGQYCLSGGGESESGNAEDIMIKIVNVFAQKEDGYTVKSSADMLQMMLRTG